MDINRPLKAGPSDLKLFLVCLPYACMCGVLILRCRRQRRLAQPLCLKLAFLLSCRFIAALCGALAQSVCNKLLEFTSISAASFVDTAGEPMRQ